MAHLLQSVEFVLNWFVEVDRLFNRYLGYGWGFLAFLAVLSFVSCWPGLSWYQKMVSQGMSSEQAAKTSSWLSGPCFLAALLISAYVYSHGGNYIR